MRTGATLIPPRLPKAWIGIICKYIASSSLRGLILVISMTNHLLHLLSCPLLITFIPYQTPSQDLTRRFVLLFTRYTLFPSSFYQSVCAYLVLETKFCRMYSFIWIGRINKHQLKSKYSLEFHRFSQDKVVWWMVYRYTNWSSRFVIHEGCIYIALVCNKKTPAG